jgi:inhibitor of KinA sporulation pathway (predicted exonuclease)
MALEYGWHGQTALDEALKRFNLTLEGTHHRGKDDAYNIAKIYAAHLKSVRGIK